MVFTNDNIRYVDMAIYIDSHIYEEKFDEEKIYLYLCDLVYMLASKKRFFTNKKDCRDFSIFFASILLLRLEDKRQFILDDDGNYQLPKIKSILNYIKKTIYPYKVQYQQKYYKQDRNEEELTYEGISNLEINNNFIESELRMGRTEFELCLESVPETIKHVLKFIPHKKNSSEYNNIYISCLLTFLNQISLSKYEIKRLNNITKSEVSKDTCWDQLYRKGILDDVVLFHLDTSYRDYIGYLVNKVKIELKNNMSDILYLKCPIVDISQILSIKDEEDRY